MGVMTGPDFSLPDARLPCSGSIHSQQRHIRKAQEWTSRNMPKGYDQRSFSHFANTIEARA